MPLIADIFITTKGRQEIFKKTLEILKDNTPRDQFRLTIIDDTGDGSRDPLVVKDSLYSHIIPDRFIFHSQNQGLGPSINEALSLINAENEWYSHPTHGDATKVSPFVCYLQDDILVSGNWLQKMAKFFLLFEKQHNLGFASGIECIEHPTKLDLGNGMILKDWIRAANMFGRREYWMSMYPIPRFDPETGRVRAKPNDGMGSGVDWWFVRDHSNSVCNSGRTNIVFPGMMVHAGYKESTWLKRELPESESDKRRIG